MTTAPLQGFSTHQQLVPGFPPPVQHFPVPMAPQPSCAPGQLPGSFQANSNENIVDLIEAKLLPKIRDSITSEQKSTLSLSGKNERCPNCGGGKNKKPGEARSTDCQCDIPSNFGAANRDFHDLAKRRTLETTERPLSGEGLHFSQTKRSADGGGKGAPGRDHPHERDDGPRREMHFGSNTNVPFSFSREVNQTVSRPVSSPSPFRDSGAVGWRGPTHCCRHAGCQNGCVFREGEREQTYQTSEGSSSRPRNGHIDPAEQNIKDYSNFTPSRNSRSRGRSVSPPRQSVTRQPSSKQKSPNDQASSRHPRPFTPPSPQQRQDVHSHLLQGVPNYKFTSPGRPTGGERNFPNRQELEPSGRRSKSILVPEERGHFRDVSSKSIQFPSESISPRTPARTGRSSRRAGPPVQKGERSKEFQELSGMSAIDVNGMDSVLNISRSEDEDQEIPDYQSDLHQLSSPAKSRNSSPRQTSVTETRSKAMASGRRGKSRSTPKYTSTPKPKRRHIARGK